MQQQIDEYTKVIKATNCTAPDEAEAFRIKFLGSKGIIKGLFHQFKSTVRSPEEKRCLGQSLNELKRLAEHTYQVAKERVKIPTLTGPDSVADLTLPGPGFSVGSRHPLSLVRNEITHIFQGLGFVLAEEDLEIEDDWHNFSALNFPKEHPARDMQDTFFIRQGDAHQDAPLVLRTHTSSVQIRIMEKGQPPFRVIIPGRVYRNEAVSARTHCFFHQLEGLYVDEEVSFADLKQTLYYFVQALYDTHTHIRFRPSYFPFTKPSAEMDISCSICSGMGCPLCKHSGWVEILGCGMVDPQVLENCHIDSQRYTGFAFGMGIERIAGLKYQIHDLRLFSENDVRFLKQFQTAIV